MEIPSYDQKRFPHMTEEILRQILIVRDTGKTNMFDAKHVYSLATNLECEELATFIVNCPREYIDFILHGK